MPIQVPEHASDSSAEPRTPRFNAAHSSHAAIRTGWRARPPRGKHSLYRNPAYLPPDKLSEFNYESPERCRVTTSKGNPAHKLCISGIAERAELTHRLRNLERGMWARKSNDYVTIAAALRWTMEQGLGDGWNPETARALRAVFTMFLEEL